MVDAGGKKGQVSIARAEVRRQDGSLKEQRYSHDDGREASVIFDENGNAIAKIGDIGLIREFNNAKGMTVSEALSRDFE